MSFFALISHPLLDVFQAATPILYPLISESIHININAGILIDQGIRPYLSATLKFTPTNFNQFSSFNAPLFASTMIPIAMLLVLIPIIKSKFHNNKSLQIKDVVTAILLISNDVKDVKSIVKKLKSKGVKIVMINDSSNDKAFEITNHGDLIVLSSHGMDKSKMIEKALDQITSPYTSVVNARNSNAKNLKKKSMIGNIHNKIMENVEQYYRLFIKDKQDS